MIGDLANLLGWDKDTILNLPFHEALYYQIKARTRRGGLSEWVL